MWTQIIFFAAVALIIILLLRRAAFAKQGIGYIGSGAKSTYSFVGRIFSGIPAMFSKVFSAGKRFTPKIGNMPKVKNRDLSPTKIMTNPANHQEGHAFWQDEAMSEKLDLSSHFEEGEILYKAGKFDDAEQYYLKAASNNPGDSKIYARLGLLYLQTKSYSDAIEALKVAVKLDKYNPSRHYNLSLAYWGNKDIQKAISSVREAITLDPVTPKYRQLLEQLLNG